TFSPQARRTRFVPSWAIPAPARTARRFRRGCAAGEELELLTPTTLVIASSSGIVEERPFIAA
ncbi:MAG TPA: hypothetical protein VH744_01625, partial [Terriglobales bacterium]